MIILENKIKLSELQTEEAGFPRVGRYVADPEARRKIEEVVDKWIER